MDCQCTALCPHSAYLSMESWGIPLFPHYKVRAQEFVSALIIHTQSIKLVQQEQLHASWTWMCINPAFDEWGFHAIDEATAKHSWAPTQSFGNSLNPVCYPCIKNILPVASSFANTYSSLLCICGYYQPSSCCYWHSQFVLALFLLRDNSRERERERERERDGCVVSVTAVSKSHWQILIFSMGHHHFFVNSSM